MTPPGRAFPASRRAWLLQAGAGLGWALAPGSGRGAGPAPATPATPATPAALAAGTAPGPSRARPAAPAPQADPVRRGRKLVFPRDHGAHPGSQIEWWYVTGWLLEGGPVRGAGGAGGAGVGPDGGPAARAAGVAGVGPAPRPIPGAKAHPSPALACSSQARRLAGKARPGGVTSPP